MNKLNIFLITMILLGCGLLSKAQTVYPGDADDNGEVNQYDLLYIGYAFGSVGPMRLGSDVEFSPQFIPLLWSNAFPDGLNYAYADANGNGVVDFADILSVGANYGQTREMQRPIDFLIGTENLDPPLQFGVSSFSEPITAGSVIEMPILLGSEEIPATDVNGIAFSFHCNHPELIADISLDLSDSWIGADSNAFYFTKYSISPLQIEADVALTRFGQGSVSGYGPIGVLTIVIEGDLVGFIPSGDSLKFTMTMDTVLMMSSLFETIPVNTIPTEIMVYHPNALPSPVLAPLSASIEIFPNPVKDEIQVFCTEKIEDLSLWNQLGQVVPFSLKSHSEQQLRLNVEALPAGAYWLRVQTPGGIAMKPMIKE